MMKNSFFETKLPCENLEMRRHLFEGSAYLLPAGSVSKRVVTEVLEVMKEHLDVEDVRQAHLRWNDEELFEKIGELRRLFYLDPHFQNTVIEIISESGFDPKRILFDPIRIRVVMPGGHNNQRAAPVYFPHRDTWYAHPQSLIVWWIPLHDLRAEETFEFFPDQFDCPVPNDSEVFNYREWVKDGPALKIGWQNRQSGVEARYPRALEEPDRSHAIGFSCKAAEQLVFAGSQYHKTLEQDFDTIRFSLDFRIIDLDDIKQGLEAPNVDNRSRGSTMNDYIRPSHTSAD